MPSLSPSARPLSLISLSLSVSSRAHRSPDVATMGTSRIRRTSPRSGVPVLGSSHSRSLHASPSLQATTCAASFQPWHNHERTAATLDRRALTASARWASIPRRLRSPPFPLHHSRAQAPDRPQHSLTCISEHSVQLCASSRSPSVANALVASAHSGLLDCPVRQPICLSPATRPGGPTPSGLLA